MAESDKPRASTNKKRTATNLILFIVICVLFVAIGGIKTARAAYFYFSPSDGAYSKNENFTLGVFVNSSSSVNAFQGEIDFPTSYLQVIDVKSDGNSIIDLWVQKPSFSNAGDSGNVRFEGVALNPGFVGTGGRVIDIVFRTKKEGAAELTFGESAILANDGLGTNVSAPNGKADLVFSGTLPQENLTKVVQENINVIQEKIKSVEEKIEAINQTGISTHIEEEEGVLGVWKILPRWVRVGVLALVGVAAIILVLIIVSFGLVVLVWLWNYSWRRREKFSRWFGRVPKKTRVAAEEIRRILKSTEEEIAGDVEYGAQELKKDFLEAETSRSLRKTLRDYWSSILKIFKRFTTKNNKKEEGEGNKEEK